MSVAEALRHQKRTIPVNPKLPPSILHPRRSASKIPLTEQAALTLNSLSLLSTVDERIPSFGSQLLLENPISRQTLDPESQANVSSAVISISHHLAPIFPVRHAQRVYEWLVNGLHAGLLGSDDEINALLLSALPFYSTPQFPAFVAAVINPKARKQWSWLKEVATSLKPAASSFIVKYCPTKIHSLNIHWAVQLVSDSIPCTFTSSFIANVTARWVTSTSRQNRRFIVLDSLQATSSLVSLDEQNNSHLICALLTVLSSAVVSGVDDEVVTAVANATIIVAIKFSDETAHTAFGTLALIVKRYGTSLLPKESVQKLIFSTKADALSKLGDIAQPLYSQLAQRALGDQFPNKKALSALRQAILGDGVKLMSKEAVTEIVAELLDLISFPSSNEDIAKLGKSCYELIVSILTPLSRGQFSNAVDLGLRRHFDARTKESVQYEYVDEVLSASLHGTPFLIIKSKSGGESMEAGSVMLMSALDHPELSVRKNALNRIVAELANSKGRPSALSEELRSKVLNIIKYDPVPSVVHTACYCASKFSTSLKPYELFKEVGLRIISLLESPSSNSQFRKEVQQVIQINVNSFCEPSIDSEPFSVLAFMVSMSISKQLGNDPIELERSMLVLRKCLTHVGLNLSSFTEAKTTDTCALFVQNAVESMAKSLSFDHLLFLKSQLNWKPSWIFSTVNLWTNSICLLSNKQLVGKLLSASLETLSTLKESSFKSKFAETLSSLIHAYSKQSKHSNIPHRNDLLTTLWQVSAAQQSEEACGKIFRLLAIEFQKPVALSILKTSYENSTDSRVQIVSFKWYIQFAIVDVPIESVLIDLIKVCYCDNITLRKYGQQFAKSYLNLSKTDMSKPVRRIFKSLSKNASQKFEENEYAQDITGRLQMWLGKLVINPHNERYNISPPLKTDRSSSGVIPSLFQALNTSSEAADRITLLRALFNHRIDNGDNQVDHSVWWSSLIDCLNRLVEEQDNYSLECAARLIILFAENENCPLPLATVDSVLLNIRKFFLVVDEGGKEDIDDDDARQITVTAGCVLLYRTLKQSDESEEMKKRVLSMLLSLSSRSSTVGRFVRDVLDASTAKLFPFGYLEQMLSSSSSLVLGTTKRERVERKLQEPSFDVKAISVQSFCVGALEAVRRWITSKSMANHTTEIQTLDKTLWEFVNVICTRINDRSKKVGEQLEYILLLSLDILSGLTKAKLCDATRYQQTAYLVTLGSVLSYSGQDSESEEESASVTALKRAILDFVVVLAPVSKKDMQQISSSVFTALLKSRDVRRISGYVEIIVPSFLAVMSFKSVAGKLCKAAFSGSNPHSREDLRGIIAHCCRLAPDVQDAVTDTIKHIVKLEKDNKSNEQLGTECSHLLIASNLSVMQDLISISKSSEDIRPHIAPAVLMNSSFTTKFFETMTSTNDEEKSQVMEAYSKMVLSLANHNAPAKKESAMMFTFGLLPVSALGTCFENALQFGSVESKTEVMSSFASRLNDYDSPLSLGWDDEKEIVDVDNDDKSVKKEFLNRCTRCISKEMTSNELSSVNLVRGAMLCSASVIKRFGTIDLNTSMKLAAEILEKLEDCMVHARGLPNKTSEVYCRSTSAALRCLSTVVSSFGTSAVSIIPRLLDAALTLIEWGFGGNSAKTTESAKSNSSDNQKAVLTMANSAVRVCLSIIESAPEFFGEKSLKRLACLLVMKHSKVLEEVLKVGMQQLPSASVVSAVSSTCEQLLENEACATGIGTIMDCLRNGLFSMKKSQIKLKAKNLLEICLRCLEYGRGDTANTTNYDSMLFPPSERIENSTTKGDTVLSDLKLVDDKCGELLTTLTLRLPESDFKVLFDKMAQWCEAGSIPDRLGADCKKVGIRLHGSLLRATPFYRLSVKLFEKLEMIMVPYYMQQISKVLAIIEFPNVRKKFLKAQRSSNREPTTRRGDGKGKKRKRVHVEEDQAHATCDHFTRLQMELQDVCLDGLTKMFDQGESSTKLLGSDIVSKIQNALLKCFDERDGQCERVTKAFCALSVRISEMRGGDGSKEESRDLLNSISRQLLLRTREDVVPLRQGALVSSRAIAVAVGDEYLVTLPETMPVLAEVIDDEDPVVQKAAKAFGLVMQSMAGEPILNQLK